MHFPRLNIGIRSTWQAWEGEIMYVKAIAQRQVLNVEILLLLPVSVFHVRTFNAEGKTE